MKKIKGTMAMSFSLAEMIKGQSSVNFKHSGVNTPMPTDTAVLKKMQESFGFLNGNDSNKFFPDVTGSSVVPKPEDFVKVPFRLLSATIVAGHSWRATDFSDVKTLKASKEKLVAKPLYYDHDTDLANWVGIVESTSWSDERISSTGVKIPAGIDGILAIDAKTNPKIARGVLMGAIFSNSVTVLFDWEASHEFADENQFLMAIGTIAKDNRMVTRKVTKVYDYHESSLVWLGADPFAKMIDEKGDLVHVDESSVVSFAKEIDEEVKKLYNEKKNYYIDACLSKSVALSLTKEYEFSTGGNKPEKPSSESNMKKELLLMLTAMLGLAEGAELTEADIKKLTLAKPGETSVPETELATLKADAGKVPTLTADLTKAQGEVTALTKEKGDLTAEVEKLKPLATSGEQYIKDKRDEVIRLYKLSVENKPDAAVLDMFTKAAPEALEGLLAQYTKDTAMKFSGTCKDCNSTNFTFRSTVSTDPAKVDAPVVSSGSFENIINKFDKPSMTLAKPGGVE